MLDTHDPRHIPYMTKVTITGPASDLKALTERCFTREDGKLRFDPRRFEAPPQFEGDAEGQYAEGREALLLLRATRDDPGPREYPQGGRAEKAARMIDLIWRYEDISPDRWITLRDAAGLPADADEHEIARGWLRQNPDKHALAEAWMRNIYATGYASEDLWMIDHWGFFGLGIAPAVERGEDALVLPLVGNGGAPDLLIERMSRAFPKLTFEVLVWEPPYVSWILRFADGAAQEKRHPKGLEEHETVVRAILAEHSLEIETVPA